MKQKTHITKDGIVGFGQRINLYSPKPISGSRKLDRLHKLIKGDIPKFCVVRGEGIGDVIMTTPTIKALRQQFPNSEITYATNTRYLNGALVKTLMYNPYINNIIERDLLKDEDYDVVINLHCPAIIHEQPQTKPANRIDLFANHAGLSLQDPVPKYYIQESEIEWGREKLNLSDKKDKLLLVQIQASSTKRSISEQKIKDSLIELYSKHKIRSIILAHKSSDHPNDIMWNNIPGSIYLENLDIREIASIMVHCDLVLCPDSSILHLAGALGVPTVSIFTSTHPDSRINYYKNTIALWGGKDVLMCPCWYSFCASGYACNNRINKEMIIDSCLKHMQDTNKVNLDNLIKNIPYVEIETEII